MGEQLTAQHSEQVVQQSKIFKVLDVFHVMCQDFGKLVIEQGPEGFPFSGFCVLAGGCVHVCAKERQRQNTYNLKAACMF